MNKLNPPRKAFQKKLFPLLGEYYKNVAKRNQIKYKDN